MSDEYKTNPFDVDVVATCDKCGADNLSDYPVCDSCALDTHFTDRQDCIHCFMAEIEPEPLTDADLCAMERLEFLGRCGLDIPSNRLEVDFCDDERCQGGVIVGTERICSDGTVDTNDYPCPMCAPRAMDKDVPF